MKARAHRTLPALLIGAAAAHYGLLILFDHYRLVEQILSGAGNLGLTLIALLFILLRLGLLILGPGAAAALILLAALEKMGASRGPAPHAD